METKQKEKIHKIVRVTFAAAILLYGLQPGFVFGAGSAQTNLSQAASLSENSFAQNPVVLSGSVHQVAIEKNVTTFCGAQSSYSAEAFSQEPDLQNSAVANEIKLFQNDFSQQAYQLNPELSSTCLQISLGGVVTQQRLAVKTLDVSEAIAVQKSNTVLTFKLEQGNGNESSAFNVTPGNSFENSEQVQSGARVQIAAVAFSNNKINTVSLNRFEVLRC